MIERPEEILEEIEAHLSKAKPVPLTDQVRIDKNEFRELLQRLREALAIGR